MSEQTQQDSPDDAREKLIRESAERFIDRLALCPDHRDKATGRCIVCQAEERTRAELREALTTLQQAHPLQWQPDAAPCRKPMSDTLVVLPRYSIWEAQGTQYVDEEADGPWVQWPDVDAELTRLRAQLQAVEQERDFYHRRADGAFEMLKVAEAALVQVRTLIEHELQTHVVCVNKNLSGSQRSDEIIGFHRGLHWVLELLRPASPGPEEQT